MEWIGYLKHLVSYWETGLFAFVVLAICLSYFQKIRAPRFELLTGDLGEWSTTQITAWEGQFEALDFHRIGCFSWAATGGVVFFMRAYLSADGQHVGVIHNSYAIVSGRWHAVGRTAKILLLTQLSPLGIIGTDNGRTEDVILFMPERVNISAPWKRAVKDVFSLHLLACEAAQENRFAVVAVNPALVGDLFGSLARKYYDHLVRKGLMRHAGDGAYRMTLKGVAICIPVLFWNFSYSWVLRLYRPGDQKLYRKVYQRLQRLRSVC